MSIVHTERRGGGEASGIERVEERESKSEEGKRHRQIEKERHMRTALVRGITTKLQ